MGVSGLITASSGVSVTGGNTSVGTFFAGTAAISHTLDVTGLMTGSAGLTLTGGTLSAGTLSAGTSTLGATTVSGGLLVSTGTTAVGPLGAGSTTLSGALNSSTGAVFSSTVSAPSFVGAFSIGGTGGGTGSIAGVLPIANGGTSASTWQTALQNLNIADASSYILAARIGAGSITSGMMASPGTATIGPCYQVYADSSGRLTNCSATIPTAAQISDGSGQSVAETASGTSFYYGGSVVGLWNSTGLGVGTNNPGAKLDVNGNVRIQNSAGQASPNQLQLMTGSTGERWALTTDGVAEASGNVGSDLILKAYDNTGVAISNIPFTLTSNW